MFELELLELPPTEGLGLACKLQVEAPANSRCCRIRAKGGLRPLGRELPPTSLDGVCSDAVTCERTRALGVYLGHLVKQQGPERRHQAGRYVMLHAWFLKT